ncbi:ADAM 17-like protease isoform X1 [Varroa destructor]|uniref:Disintegrin domain-containing protein n=1 Tax=Varroa destructor TaxID=109461 RepID=A0A7M7K2X3_VARDE|nr:ADAM 17-like protease isoform X1 [Varroa destructor]
MANNSWIRHLQSSYCCYVWCYLLVLIALAKDSANRTKINLLIIVCVSLCFVSPTAAPDDFGQRIPDNDFGFRIEDFGNVLVKRSVNRPYKSSSSVVGSNHLFEGIVDGYLASSVTIFGDGQQYIGFANIDGNDYDITAKASSLKKQSYWAGARNVRIMKAKRRNKAITAYQQNKVYDCSKLKEVTAPENKLNIRKDLTNNMHCTLRVVCDFHFMVRVGEGLADKARFEMAAQVAFADFIFGKTPFRDSNNTYTGFRFSVGEHKVLENFTDATHYGMEYPIEDPAIALQMFSVNDSGDNDGYCGAVLFSGRKYEGCPRLLTSYIGDLEYVLGACAPKRRIYDSPPFFITPNTILIAAIRDDEVVSREQLVEALVRGLARILGARSIPQLHPSELESSKMKKSKKRNRKRLLPKFSQQQIEEMSFFMRHKQCLMRKGFCGNLLVEGKEQCDEGPLGGPCCSPTCLLESGAECSDQNYGCCEFCSISPVTWICSAPDYDNCRDVGRCTGRSHVCPEIPAKNGTRCRDHGLCRDGVCRHICEELGLTKCFCSDKEDQCKVCCIHQTRCKPFGVPLYLDEDSPCAAGKVCRNHKCVPISSGAGL